MLKPSEIRVFSLLDTCSWSTCAADPAISLLFEIDQVRVGIAGGRQVDELRRRDNVNDRLLLPVRTVIVRVGHAAYDHSSVGRDGISIGDGNLGR